MLQTTYGQKKIKHLQLNESQLNESKTYFSVLETLIDKKKAYILNLENQKLNKLPEDIEKLQNIQVTKLGYN